MAHDPAESEHLFNLELENNEKIKNSYENATTNLQKAKIIREFLDSNRPSSFPKQEKDDEASKSLRLCGNKLFEEQQFEITLDFYNEAICFAEKGSKHLGIGYANRSAVYYLMGLHEECLKSINLAKQSNYPEHLMPKIMKREKECLELLKKKTKEPSLKKREFKLSYPANENIPSIVNCIEMKKTQKYEKGLYATEEIHAGDILIIEEANMSSLDKDVTYNRCWFCLKEKHKNLIPCNFCTKVMFCSDDCRDKSWNDSHEFECEIIDGLILFNSRGILSLKQIWMAIRLFDYSVDEWIRYYESTDKAAINTLGTDYKDLYKCILGLHTDNINDGVIFDSALVAHSLYAMILDNEKIKNLFQEDYQKEFLFRVLFNACCTRTNYSYNIDEILAKKWSDIANKPMNKKIGTGLYIIAGLLNHSCSENVQVLLDKRKMIVYAERNIPKGQQLFCSYGYNFAINKESERKDSLKERYNFDCDCEACFNHYPTTIDLLSIHFQTSSEREKATLRKKLPEFPFEYSNKKILKEKFALLDKNEQNYVSFEQIKLRQEIQLSLQFDLREYNLNVTQ